MSGETFDFEFMLPRTIMDNAASGTGMIEVAVGVLPVGELRYRGKVRIGKNSFEYVSKLKLPVEYLVNSGASPEDLKRLPIYVSHDGRPVHLDGRKRAFFASVIGSSILSYSHNEKDEIGRRHHYLGKEEIEEDRGMYFFLNMPPHLVPEEFLDL